MTWTNASSMRTLVWPLGPLVQVGLGVSEGHFGRDAMRALTATMPHMDAIASIATSPGSIASGMPQVSASMRSSPNRYPAQWPRCFTANSMTIESGCGSPRAAGKPGSC
jgi:hypothetical protein